MNQQTKSKAPLVIIVLIAVLTPVLSTLLFFFWQPPQQVNHGELLPPHAVAADWRDGSGKAFAPPLGKWTLLAAADGDCDAACRRRLCRMRQLRLMLPGSYQRLHRAWLVTDDATPPTTLPQATDCGEVADEAVREQAQTADSLADVQLLYGADSGLPQAATAKHYLYLLNADGVWVMRFSDELSLYEIRDDLKRLLRLSKGRRFIPKE